MDATDRYQRSPTSKHAGHDPTDPRVAVVEDLAIEERRYEP